MSNSQAQRKVQKFVVSGGTNEHSLQKGLCCLTLTEDFCALKKFSLKQIFSIRCQAQFFRSNQNYKTNYFAYSFAVELAQHLLKNKSNQT